MSQKDQHEKTDDQEKIDEDIINNLRVKRTIGRTKMTKMTNKLIAEYEKEAKNEKINSDHLAFLIKKAEESYSELNNINSDLLEYGIEDDGDQTSKAEMYLTYSNRLLNRLDAAATAPPGSICNSERPFQAPAFKYKVEELPKFYGDPRKYPEWWSVFKIVHEEDETILPKVKKFLLLQKCLKKTAADVLAGKHLVAENYDIVIKELNDKYGNPLLQIALFSAELLGITPSCYDAEALRKVISTFEISWKELQRIFRDIDDAELKPCTDCVKICEALISRVMDMMLAPLLLEKLPSELVMIWKRKCDAPKEVYCLEEMIKFVSKEIRDLETPGPGMKKQPVKTSEPVVASMSTLVNNTEKCVICSSSEHSHPSKCSEFLSFTLDTRSSCAKDKGLCFKCLNYGHRTSSCKSNTTCRAKGCGRGGHHTLLHGFQIPTSTWTKSEKPTSDKNVDKPKNKKDKEESSYNVSTVKPDVSLMTAVVKVSNPITGNSKLAKVLLDSGSTRTYVRSDLVNELKLIPEGSSTFRSMLFGERQTAPTEYPIVELKLTGRDVPEGKSLLVKALSTKHLAHPIAPVRRVLPKDLDWLPLADDGSVDISRVDLLIGADFYWDIISPEPAIRRSNQPTFVPSVFGWLLHGPGGEFERSYFVIHDDNNEIANLWKLDVFGIEDADNQNNSEIDVAFKKEVGRYEAKLPWCSDDRPRSNLPVAMKRLFITEASMSSKEMEEYDQYMKVLLEDGVLEVAPMKKSDVFFLPHFAIRREGKRMRVVFDGKAGINQYLEVGPNLLQDLLVVLLQSRFWKYLAQGDVKAAFHQIQVAEEDRDYLTVLWRGTRYRFKRVPFGLAPSPAILNSSFRDLWKVYEEDYPFSVKKLETGTYVDDVVSGGNTVSEREYFVQESTHIFSEGGFELTKWKYSGDENDPVGTVLGVIWDRQEDTYSIDLSRCFVKPKNQLTRRELVSSVSRIFDPLGICGPFTLTGRLLIQRSWIEKKGWDDPVDKEIAEEYLKWSNETKEISQVTIPRQVCLKNDFELHVFSDASKNGYCAAIYICTEESAQLFFARARAAPLKSLTIPKMELLGCLLAVRLFEKVKHLFAEHNIRPIFWTDSLISYFWITNHDLRLKVWVKNRVEEIRGTVATWRHIPGEQNPADVGSRGIKLKQLVSHGLWWDGPPFLKNRNEWPPIPRTNEIDFSLLSIDTEQTLLVNEETEDEVGIEEDPIFDIAGEAFSKSAKKTAMIMRFIFNSKPTNRECRKSGPISLDEINAATDYWIQKSQKEYFNQEYTALSNGKQISKNSCLSALRPFFCPERKIILGLPRNGEIPLPILYYEGDVVLSIFLQAHLKAFHGGPSSTLMTVREKYHVIRGRVLAKNIVRGCMKCRRYRSVASGSNEGFLPENRVKPARPFSVIGADFFGPIMLEGKKIWILLITCAVIRAIHLEIVDSQEEEEVQYAFRRFMARRGEPKIVYSDNSKTFKKMAGSFQSWIFIPEKAPWFGGFYERMVKNVKEGLRIVFHGCSLSRVALQTAIIEVEAVVNSRPLTTIGSVEEILPLTPQHFLLGVSPTQDFVVPSPEFDPGKQWRYRLRIADMFWRRFSKEYLSQLRVWRRKLHGDYQALARGDVVLVEGGKMVPRSKWRLARVLEVDKHAATIILGSSKVVTRRPLCHLYPMEINCGDISLPDIENEDPEPNVEQENNIDDTHEPPDESNERVSRFGRRVKKTRDNDYIYDDG